MSMLLHKLIVNLSTEGGKNLVYVVCVWPLNITVVENPNQQFCKLNKS